MDSSTTRPTPSRPSRSTTVCTPFGPLAVRNTRPDGASPTSKKSRPTSTPAAHNAVIAQLLCSSLFATRFAPAPVRKSTLASAPLPASRRQNQGPNELRSPAIKPQPDHHANTQGPRWTGSDAGSIGSEPIRSAGELDPSFRRDDRRILSTDDRIVGAVRGGAGGVEGGLQ